MGLIPDAILLYYNGRKPSFAIGGNVIENAIRWPHYKVIFLRLI